MFRAPCLHADRTELGTVVPGVLQRSFIDSSQAHAWAQASVNSLQYGHCAVQSHRLDRLAGGGRSHARPTYSII